jgi:sulfatase maturation enzyme AslB (radical SAM superfamily)
MTKNICNEIINFLFNLDDKNIDFLNFHFIGGEPLLNISIIDYFCKEFIFQCNINNHKWINNWHGYIISNGLLYFNTNV